MLSVSRPANSPSRARCGRAGPVSAALALALLAVVPAPARAEAPLAQSAVVEQVVDGDTIRVRAGGQRFTVRLIGVDTPELRDRDDPAAPPEPYARAAADYTRTALGRRTVRLELEPGARLDRYGRTLAYVFLADGTFFNRVLLQQGYARLYRGMPPRHRAAFAADEAAARAAGRGLWAAVAAAPAGPVIGNRRSRIYHLPGQRHYDRVAAANRVYFDSEDAARAAGYRPANR